MRFIIAPRTILDCPSLGSRAEPASNQRENRGLTPRGSSSITLAHRGVERDSLLLGKIRNSGTAGHFFLAALAFGFAVLPALAGESAATSDPLPAYADDARPKVPLMI